MKYNNKYTNFIDKIDVSDEFKNNLINQIRVEAQKEEIEKMKNNMKNMNKELNSLKLKNKIAAIAATAGVLACGSFAYATVVPEEFKDSVKQKIDEFFGITTILEENYENEVYSEIENQYITGLQDETVIAVLNSDKENIEDYTELTDADIYGIGDSTEGTLVESNYKQYDFNVEYDENGNIIEKQLEKYENKINIKIGKINYGCLEKLDSKTTILDGEGNIIGYKEPTIEDVLKYQQNEFEINWNEYYHRQEEFDEKLYFKITGMLIMNGNNKNEEDYNNYSRAKKIKVIFDNKQEEIIELKDSKDAQYIDLKYISYDISKPINISVEILDTYKGDFNTDTYLADIQFGISSNIPQGR